MVGWAMNRALEGDASGDRTGAPCRQPLGHPGGRLHFPTPTTMAERLRAEGVEVADDQVVDFDAHFWDPSTEL